MGFKHGNDSLPHLSPNLHFNFQIKMHKRKLRSEMGLLITLQAQELVLRSLRHRHVPRLYFGPSGGPVAPGPSVREICG